MKERSKKLVVFLVVFLLVITGCGSEQTYSSEVKYADDQMLTLTINLNQENQIVGTLFDFKHDNDELYNKVLNEKDGLVNERNGLDNLANYIYDSGKLPNEDEFNYSDNHLNYSKIKVAYDDLELPKDVGVFSK